jgi:hypothetical protein
MKNFLRVTLFALVSACAFSLHGQTSSFTYQGNLTDGVTPANGTYQMQFSVFNALSAGAQQGSTITNNSVSVVNGVFTVQLDFTSAPFAAGDNRWLEIAVKKPADPGFTTLTPRQQLTASPYSIRTLSASASDSLSASCVACVVDAHIDTVSGSKVTGTVANATNATNATTATTAGNVTGIVAIANGGTGSSTKNFVDLSTVQSIAGNKTFTNNVTVSGTLTAVLGQTVSTVFSNAGVTITPATTFTLIPNMTQTITIPANSFVYIASDGGIQTTATAATGFSNIDVALFADGVLLPNAAYARIHALNSAGLIGVIQYWNFSTIAALTPGAHTITVQARGVGNGSNATVGGDNSTVMQGSLTVMIIKN